MLKSNHWPHYSNLTSGVLTAQGCQTVTSPVTGDLTAQMSLFTNHSALCDLLNICAYAHLPPTAALCSR